MLVVTMDIPLTKDQSIYLILLQKISISTICQNIILLKNKIEINEAYEYHSTLWNNIASKYFQCLKKRYPTYSYVLDGDQYIARADNNLIFFYQTSISYQIRDLVMGLINEYRGDNLSEEEKKRWRKEDDIIYGKLARRILF